MVLGNIKEDTISSILSNSTILEEWRKCTLKDYSECLKYEYCDYCSICSGQGYIQHGDYLKPAESSCYMAKARFALAQKLLSGEDPLKGKDIRDAVRNLPQYGYKLKRMIGKG
jgi:hypothetical protein